MGVQGNQAVIVPDDYRPPVTAHPTRGDNCSRLGGLNRRSERDRQIDAVMHPSPSWPER